MDSVEYLSLGILTLSLLCHSVQASVFLCPIRSLLALHLSLTLSVSPSPSIALSVTRTIYTSVFLFLCFCRLSLPLLLYTPPESSISIYIISCSLILPVLVRLCLIVCVSLCLHVCLGQLVGVGCLKPGNSSNRTMDRRQLEQKGNCRSSRL